MTNVRAGYNQALNWVKNNTIPEQGVIVSSLKKTPYFEVTGYLIPTLLDSGELDRAYRYADYLSCVQMPDGAYAGPDGQAYIFDTAQVLRGLLAAYQKWGKFENNIFAAAEYVLKHIEDKGRIPANYGNIIPEAVHLYTLAPLMQFAKLFRQDDAVIKIQKALEYYKQPAILDPKYLTHFSAYIVDGLIEMGEMEFVRSFVQRVFSRQKKDGSISAFEGASWVCLVGVAQYAIIGYKLGMIKQADLAIKYLCSVQNVSGGFLGSKGFRAEYFVEQEISWANKFFMDAVVLKIQSFFNANAAIFPSDIKEQDGRVEALLSALGDINGKKVLDIGCGKGRFAARIKEKFPNVIITGLDISEELLRDAAKVIPVVQGSMINLPFKNSEFDAVIAIESLEHCLDTDKALAEMARVLKTEGRTVIIDKNLAQAGRMDVTDFETWFNDQDIKRILETNFTGVRAEFTNYDTKKADGLFILWTGIKGQNVLSADEWSTEIRASRTIDDIKKQILSHQYPVWMLPVLKVTEPGDRVLELGSGTGELSAILGRYGRKPFLMDFSKTNIDLSKDVFNVLNLSGDFFCQNVLEPWQILDGQVDWVFSSGLLEHFSDQEIQNIMLKSKTAAKKGVICLVPNAASLMYRAGKFEMEQNGVWSYGFEDPKFSMKKFFEDVGLVNIQEFSVAPYHALNFLEIENSSIKHFFDELNAEDIKQLKQGYLLFTYGEKSGA
ncbi:MAG: methyltransferase domain-containing protein [Candidatus Omnitrophica bacterium]|nr:methyltransferase domain-containing protein [Candidatus Omnitrophota bacterium]